MEEYKFAIQRLKQIDSSNYPVDEIIYQIGKLGRFGLLKQTLHKGMILLRGRPEANSYQLRKDLSYKPQEFNKTYQRASTPNKTMFYGVAISQEELEGKPSWFPRLVTALEASTIIRDDADGIEPLTYSQWVVTEDIHLLAICYYQNFPIVNQHTRSLYESFVQLSQMESPELHEKTLAVTDFLADAFAKPVHSKAPDYEYLVSALFTEVSLERAMEEICGVYYPSVRAEGGGYVVAIAPHFVDTRLKLTAAGECMVYKVGKNIKVDNVTACVIPDDTKSFEMVPVDPQYTLNKNRLREELGVYIF